LSRFVASDGLQAEAALSKGAAKAIKVPAGHQDTDVGAVAPDRNKS